MALFCGKVLMGKYAGSTVDSTFSCSVKIGLQDKRFDVKSVSLLGTSAKADLFFSLSPIKNYYQVQVTWYSGGESILEVNSKALEALNRMAEINSQHH